MRADAQRNRKRILTAAQDLYATRGTDTSTDDVARRAGVAVGTVFRHFPTKQELLIAVMKARLDEVAARAAELDADPEGLYVLFGELVADAVETRAIADLLTLGIDDQIAAVRAALEPLFAHARRTGTVREDLDLDTVMALLGATCHGAVDGQWSEDLRERSLAVLYAGMRARR